MSAQPAHSVLIVEDERIIAKDIQQTLESMGYDAFAIASSTEEALARVSERCPDLVLMDIRIEGSRDGIEAARLLNALHDVPVIFLSAHADEATLERAKKVGPYAFLSKPVKPADLRGAIETSLYRQRMDKRLRERERWFATTLSCVPDAVVTTDKTGALAYLNPAAEALLGVRSEQVIGRPVEEIVKLVGQEPASGDATPLTACLRLGKPVRLVSAQLVNHSSGASVAVSDKSAPVIIDGKMAGAVMVIHDDTEKLAVAHQLEITNRLAALGTMAAGTAHELNNPLAIVTNRVENALEALRRASPDTWPERMRQASIALADVQTAAGRMGRIIADLRNISRPPQQTMQIIDLARCIDWATRATTHEFHNRARVVHQLGTTPPVLAEESRLGQVLVNLLVNAAHAIAPGDFEHNEVVIGTRTDEAGNAVISVRDTGHGMTPEVLKRIFDPFFTTKDVGAGTGLGLAISHGIVTSLKGELRASSTPGVGSTFEILLPPAAAAVPEVASAPAVATAGTLTPVRRGRILVIDDEEVLLTAIASILELDGHEVVVTKSARDALAMLVRGERFDLILSDMAMPNMTGMEFFDALRAHDAQLARRVMFMSGGAVTADADEFLRRIAGKYIAKPFKSDVLRRAIQQALAGDA
jgi:PAS domain S-box-containing protein